MTDVWNYVTVYGPASEIDLFKRLSIEPADVSYRRGQSGWEGCACSISTPDDNETGSNQAASHSRSQEVWNFQQFTADSSVRYSFSFDTDGEFPTQLFECLAKRFPKLAFDCSCIEALDEFMGYGWFNAPPGGEEFRQNYKVPKNYWTGGGGCKRNRTAERKHELRIAKLEEAARRAEEAQSRSDW